MSKPTVRPSQSERVAETSRRLLTAAVELLAEQGYAQTTAVEISLRAGYSRSMVAVRYGSKATLLDQILKVEFEDRINLPVVEDVSGLVQLINHVGYVQELVRTEPQFTRAIMVLSFEAAGPASELRHRLDQWIQSADATMQACLELGVRDGSIRPDVDPTATGRDLVATGIGMMYRWVLEPDTYDISAALDDWGRRLSDALASAD